MKAMTTSQRIEGVGAFEGEIRCFRWTSESKEIKIRHGHMIFFNASSLKALKEELNLLEVYTYAYEELEKLSGQLTLDTANRLSNFLTKRYLDYPAENGSDLNPPGFKALRGFVAHELNVSTSACSQVFCGLNDKGKSRDFGSGGRKNNHVCVRQVFLPEEPRLVLLKIEHKR